MHFAERPLPIRTRGNVVVIALAAAICADALALVFESIHYGILTDLDAGTDLSFEKVDASDDRVGVAYILQGLTYIAASIAFLAWFYRAYRNLPRLGVTETRYGFGWSIGSWFVPILNLFRPKQIMNDVWRGSEPAPGPKRLMAYPHVPALIHWWWALWIVAGFAGNADFRLADRAETIPEQKDASAVAIVADLIFIVTAVIAIVVVRGVTDRQEEARRVTLEAGPSVPPGYGQPGYDQPPPGGWQPPTAPGGPPPGYGQTEPGQPPPGQPPPAPPADEPG